MSKPVATVLLCLGIIALGSASFCGSAVLRHAYDDHVLIDKAREADQQRLIQAAEQVKQFQQQQAAPAPTQLVK